MKINILQIIILLLMIGCGEPDPVVKDYPNQLSVSINGMHFEYTDELSTIEFPAYDSIPNLFRLDGAANSFNDAFTLWIENFDESRNEYDIASLSLQMRQDGIPFYAGGSSENAGSGHVTFTTIDDKHVKGIFQITTSIYTYEPDPGIFVSKQLILTDGKFDLERR